MNTDQKGHFSADLNTANGRESFRMTNGLSYDVRQGVHCIEAINGSGEGFYVYLPAHIESGTYALEVGLPSVIHVMPASEAELYPVGTLTLTVGGAARFAGTFSGVDANGIVIENGSFRLEGDA
ncbi:hypothetical protein SAMN04487857_101322 [Pseudomonas sp. ok272]|uniref:hypothetical protein n=1 Tax=unclassified Pseudomonas TaxID=196821 RepID=UPI0008C38A24|nr:MULTISPECIES: hypothetical protein [unclassified Pseudomonas]SEM35694.1 hypothetical protein SAMN04487857_101322 [Pseudomonas sp. ok272]SFM35929.1 hypothetical protein SAMN04487858_102324 [Pseudomonas sp. ok602]